MAKRLCVTELAAELLGAQTHIHAHPPASQHASAIERDFVWPGLVSGWPLSADSWDDQALVIAGSAQVAHAGIAKSTLLEYDGAPRRLFAI